MLFSQFDSSNLSEFVNLQRVVVKSASRRLASGKVVQVRSHVKRIQEAIEGLNPKLKAKAQNIVNRYIDSGELPPLRDLPGLVGEGIRTPVRTSKLLGTVKQASEDLGIVRFNSKKTQSKLLAEEVMEDLKNNVDLQTNTGGFIGSVVGGSVGGVPGALAGDYLGARITRRAVYLVKSINKLNQDIGAGKLSKDMGMLQKMKLTKKIYSEMSDYEKELYEDTIGWAIGNAVAQTVPVPIPFKGAMVASVMVPDAMQAIKSGNPQDIALYHTRKALQAVEKKDAQIRDKAKEIHEQYLKTLKAPVIQKSEYDKQLERIRRQRRLESLTLEQRKQLEQGFNRI